MSLLIQKEQEAKALEENAQSVEQYPKIKRICSIICAVLIVVAIIVLKTQDFVVKKGSILGIPVIEYTAACWFFVVLFLLIFALLISLPSFPDKKEAENQAQSLRDQASSIRNMSDSEFEQYLRQQRIKKVERSVLKSIAKHMIRG